MGVSLPHFLFISFSSLPLFVVWMEFMLAWWCRDPYHARRLLSPRYLLNRQAPVKIILILHGLALALTWLMGWYFALAMWVLCSALVVFRITAARPFIRRQVNHILGVDEPGA